MACTDAKFEREFWSEVGELDLDGALKALASTTRRELVGTLVANGETCACELAKAHELAPSTISHHMAVLTKAGLVRPRKQGTWVHYSLDRGALSQTVNLLRALVTEGDCDEH